MIFSILLFAFLSTNADSSIELTRLESQLESFHENPGYMMDQLPSEVLGDGTVLERGIIAYGDLNHENKFDIRQNIREGIMRSNSSSYLSVPGVHDSPENLVERGEVTRDFFSLIRLSSHVLSVTPWSDSYWPFFKGLIGIRYADSEFPNSKKWITNYEYINAFPASEIVRSESLLGTDTLSPSEKYDYLVGDTNWSLTKDSWDGGKSQYEKNGHVALWTGICHGWSAASHMNVKTPTQIVVARTAQGDTIRFYPSDTKALISLLWANSAPATRFVGSRCRISNPNKDPNGRILDGGCFDTNPATWHLSVLNQLGLNERSIVMDSTYDAQVWNFSLSAYRLRFFNPQDLREKRIVHQAITPIENYTMDKFKAYRDPKSRYVVGVAMDATYVNASNPRHHEAGSPPLKTLRYIYDLELDENHQIIGGEWYTNAHPDFLWTFNLQASAESFADRLIDPDSQWNIQDPVPEHWSTLAKKSSLSGNPMSRIIQVLTEAGL